MEEKINNPNRGAVRLKMIYNNTGASPGLKEAWGLSVWLEVEGHHLLFDTGGDAAILQGNMLNAGLDPALLDSVVISHNHWDHKNGLRWVLENTSFIPEVSVPLEVQEEYAREYPSAAVRGIKSPEEILPGIWTTGSIATTYKGTPLYEQALVIVRGEKVWLLTGCSHPGISLIVTKVTEIFPGKGIALVTGGFHLGSQTEGEVRDISETLRRLEVEKIAPSHCTGEDAIALLREEWGDYFTEFNLGDQLVLP